MTLVGMVGSIDNDMFGTDMTIGADTALHRITEAIDAIHSTASSHQRAFVIEVMGRNCGYLALMSAVAAGANWVLIPESPPEQDDWEESMMSSLRAGREVGRRLNIVIVAEGAQDKYGNPIKAEYVKDILSERLGEDTRVTSLGHVQRGGAPSAFDRYLSTVLGYAAVEQMVTLDRRRGAVDRAQGASDHQLTAMECVEQTQAVADRIAERDYETAMEMRGGSFRDSFQMLKTMVRAKPHAPDPEQRRLRLGIIHAGGPAPGNEPGGPGCSARRHRQGPHHVRDPQRVPWPRGRADRRAGLDERERMGISWWRRAWYQPAPPPRRAVPDDRCQPGEVTDRRSADDRRVDRIHGRPPDAVRAEQYPVFNLPIVCLPAAINNDLPGSEVAIGADTALNNIVSDVDKIKQSAVASGRCFVVEVMGRDCGYLALMSGLATGAERTYLPEEGISLHDLETDVLNLKDGFRNGKRLGLVITSEGSDPVYNSGFIKELFERESEGLFSVRQSILGHVQQGGDPSPSIESRRPGLPRSHSIT